MHHLICIPKHYIPALRDEHVEARLESFLGVLGVHTLQRYLRSDAALAGKVHCIISYIRRIELVHEVSYVRFIFLEKAFNEVILPTLEAKHVSRSRCNFQHLLAYSPDALYSAEHIIQKLCCLVFPELVIQLVHMLLHPMSQLKSKSMILSRNISKHLCHLANGVPLSCGKLRACRASKRTDIISHIKHRRPERIDLISGQHLQLPI